jgi:two-component system chemotaxis response regulator CheY
MQNRRVLSVLIVDDNEISRAMLRFTVCSERWYRVVGEAACGNSGLEMTERLQPDIVCLDISLPDCCGLDVLQRMKVQWPRIAVLMVTGSGDGNSVRHALQRGADGYVVKPFRPHDLLSALAQAAPQVQ